MSFLPINQEILFNCRSVEMSVLDLCQLVGGGGSP